MTATRPAPAVEPTEDRVGAIEAAGVEYLPEEARDSGPRNLSAVFLGANLTWTNVVFGAFAILFGLSFWQTVASMAVGTAVGTVAVLPTAIIGPRTGTNMTVSSGAFFGIRGRFIGSGLALAIALAFAAVTGGPAATPSSPPDIACSVRRRATSCTPSHTRRWPR